MDDKSNDYLPSVLGYSSENTVMLDLDNFSFKEIKKLAMRFMKNQNCKGYSIQKLDGLLILKSSKRHYHAVFDRHVDWAENTKYIGYACLWTHRIELLKWVVMQLVKGCSTIRVSNKGAKKPPRIVYRSGSQNNRIKHFLDERKLLLEIYRDMQKKANGKLTLTGEVEREEDYPLKVVNLS